MCCELEVDRSLTDEELRSLISPADVALAGALKMLARPSSKACLICSQITPNAGPFCSACQVTYGQSRDGLVR
jgi:hypothetical protein